MDNTFPLYKFQIRAQCTRRTLLFPPGDSCDNITTSQRFLTAYTSTSTKWSTCLGCMIQIGRYILFLYEGARYDKPRVTLMDL